MQEGDDILLEVYKNCELEGEIKMWVYGQQLHD